MKVQTQNLGKVSVTVEKDYWNPNRDYDKLTVVEREGDFGTYISRKPVPAGVVLTDREYWIPFSSLREEIIMDYSQFTDKYGQTLDEHKTELDNHEGRITEIEGVKGTMEELVNSEHINKELYDTLPSKIITGFGIGCTDYTKFVSVLTHFSEKGNGNKYVADSAVNMSSLKLPFATAEHGGAMTKEDRKVIDSLPNTIISSSPSITADNNKIKIVLTKSYRSAYTYEKRLDTFFIESATQELAGVMSAADKTTLDNLKAKLEEVNQPNGLLALNAEGQIDALYLPSYVDDVVEYEGVSAFPSYGEAGKIYVDTTTNKSYRWSGSSYIEIPKSIALGETNTTAYSGDKGKANADAIAELNNKVGAANGIATLDTDSKLTANQLPSLKTINGSSLVGTGDIELDLSDYVTKEAVGPVVVDMIFEASFTKINMGFVATNRSIVTGEPVEMTKVIFKGATSETAGAMTAADKLKLDGITDNATADTAITAEELAAILV